MKNRLKNEENQTIPIGLCKNIQAVGNGGHFRQKIGDKVEGHVSLQKRAVDEKHFIAAQLRPNENECHSISDENHDTWNVKQKALWV